MSFASQACIGHQPHSVLNIHFQSFSLAAYSSSRSVIDSLLELAAALLLHDTYLCKPNSFTTHPAATCSEQVGLLDIDICGPSIPRMLGLEGQEIHSSATGWSPVYVDDRLGVMSIGFLLPDKDDAVIWRGPRKNGLIKQFIKVCHSSCFADGVGVDTIEP